MTVKVFYTMQTHVAGENVIEPLPGITRDSHLSKIATLGVLTFVTLSFILDRINHLSYPTMVAG